MTARSNDQNLQLAVLALKNGFLSRDQAAQLIREWSAERHRPLGDLMEAAGFCSAEDRSLLEQLLNRQRNRPAPGPPETDFNTATIELADTKGDAGDAADRLLATLTSVPSKTFQFRFDESANGRPDPGAVTMDSHSRTVRDGKPDGAASPGTRSGIRYEVLRSHARGGLGEVFVARDRELGREVALKEIQLRMADDPVARTRFELEACITGGLEHPGVVPVYGYGHHDDGRPFYAMRFIRGETLKEEISRYHELPNDHAAEGLRRLTFRKLLRRFVDTCNAIAYAHSRGVLHRDIKPANVMLGRFGETLVVDWGLAKTVGRDEHNRSTDDETLMPLSGSQQSDTLHGSTVGTPAFMSPEQAAGNIDGLGPASDIFSLGATLYFLLVGRPPFEGKSARQILERVRANQFDPPLAVRPGIPRPLNAICLRAMATRPEDRYRTALELAADIEHWLADEPVAAYPETVVERARRWMRRHRTLMTAAGVLLATTAIATSVGMVLVGVEQRRTARERDRAIMAEREAATALAAESAAQRRTRQALLTVTDDFIGELLARQLVLTPADQAFFDSVIRQYRQLDAPGGSGSGTAEARAMRAEGLLRTANLQRRIGRLDDAIAGYREAQSIWTGLLEDRPGDPDLQRNLAAACGNEGLAIADQGDDRAAVECLDRAIAILRQVADGRAQRQAATTAAADNEDVEDYQKAARQELARALMNRAISLDRMRDRSAAESAYHDALNGLVSASAGEKSSSIRRDIATVQINLGALLSSVRSRADEAMSLFEAALTTLAETGENELESRRLREAEGVVRFNYGASLARTGRIDEAVEQLNRAIAVQTQLVDEFPVLAGNRQELARSRFGLARILAAIGNDSAASEFPAAIAEMERLVAQFPERPQFRKDLSAFLDAWALWARSHDAESARKAMNRALEIRHQLLAADPASPVLADELFATQVNLANFERKSERWEVAERLYRNLRQQIGADRDADPVTVRMIDFGWGDSLVALGNHAEALACWQRLCRDREDEDWATFELQRAICLAWTGKPDEGLEAALRLAESRELSPDLLYDVGCCCSVAAGQQGLDSEAGGANAAKALEWLERAAAAGFFTEDMKRRAANDPDLGPLREWTPFREFCDRLGIE